MPHPPLTLLGGACQVCDVVFVFTVRHARAMGLSVEAMATTHCPRYAQHGFQVSYLQDQPVADEKVGKSSARSQGGDSKAHVSKNDKTSEDNWRNIKKDNSKGNYKEHQNSNNARKRKEHYIHKYVLVYKSKNLLAKLFRAKKNLMRRLESAWQHASIFYSFVLVSTLSCK